MSDRNIETIKTIQLNGQPKHTITTTEYLPHIRNAFSMLRKRIKERVSTCGYSEEEVFSQIEDCMEDVLEELHGKVYRIK